MPDCARLLSGNPAVEARAENIRDHEKMEVGPFDRSRDFYGVTSVGVTHKTLVSAAQSARYTFQAMSYLLDLIFPPFGVTHVRNTSHSWKEIDRPAAV
jgi:hypothetical protein